VRGLGGVGEQRGPRGRRDDPAEAHERGREEKWRERAGEQDADDPRSGDRSAGDDRRAPRASAGEERGRERPRDDTDRLRAGEQADGELVEPKRAVEEVQIEGRDTEAEAAQRRTGQIETRVAPTEGYCG
jgi:hypothetical protein